MYTTVSLLAESDWRTGDLDPFRAVAWARAHGLSWRRGRRALAALEGAGVLELSLRPFAPGRLRLHRGAFLHRPGNDDAPWRQVRRRIDRLIADHGLAWTAVGVVALLLLVVDDRTFELPPGWTLEAMSNAWGVGRRCLRGALDQLAADGLVSYRPHRGGCLELKLLAGPGLIEPPAVPRQRRSERRRTEREAHRPGGPGLQVARRLIAHHGLERSPSRALVAAVGEALATGASDQVVLERLVACGNLAQAADPMAVLVSRARGVANDLHQAQEAEAARRAREQEARASLQRAREEETTAREVGEEEDRWVAGVLDQDLLARVASALGDKGLGARPVLVVPRILAAARAAVAARGDLEPGVAVRTGILSALPPAPEAPLPRARDGPSLTERLRALPT